jgi:tetratricopeptide (TPR) repeat protein
MADELPGYATACVLLARAYEGLGEWNAALGSWREALQIVPNSPVIRRGLERAARNAAAHAPGEEPELPSISVSAPSRADVYVADSDPAAAEGEAPGADRASYPDDEDLDRLIAELESARIVPRPDLEDVPEPPLEDDIEDVVSVTLARIYASQGEYDEAARVYELLAVQKPAEEQALRAKAEEMRSKASED